MTVLSGWRRVVEILDDVMLLVLVILLIPVVIVVIGGPLGALFWLITSIVPGSSSP